MHNENFGVVGTQAAVLAGFTMTAFAEMTITPSFGEDGSMNAHHRFLQFIYYTLVVISLSSNLYCVSQTTTLSVFGTSLSLRGT